MTSRASKLVLAAVIASSLPATALAEHDRECDHPVAYVPSPAPPAPAPDRWQDAGWRHRTWRDRELARVSAELRELDMQRADFHARFAWNHRKLRKFDRWYAARRGELEQRWYELQYVAWR